MVRIVQMLLKLAHAMPGLYFQRTFEVGTRTSCAWLQQGAISEPSPKGPPNAFSCTTSVKFSHC